MTLLFDLDDTLLEDKKTKEYYLPKLYNDYQNLINNNFDNFSNLWINGIKKYFDLYVKGVYTFQEQRNERIKEAFNNDLSEINLIKINTAFEKYFEESWFLLMAG